MLKKLKYNILFTTFLASTVLGQTDVGKETLISELEGTLMAPCCWSGTVADHGNPGMEEKIRELVSQDKTKEEIVDHFVGIYGERILALPVARGFNLMVWLAPVIVLGLGTLVLENYLKLRAKPQKAIPFKEEKIPYDDLIEKELKEME